MHCGAEVTESSTNKQHHLLKCLMISTDFAPTTTCMNVPASGVREPSSCVCLLLQDLLQSCSRGGRGIVEFCGTGTHEEPGTLTQGGALFSLVPLVWESNPKLHGGWCNHQTSGDLEPSRAGMGPVRNPVL